MNCDVLVSTHRYTIFRLNTVVDLCCFKSKVIFGLQAEFKLQKGGLFGVFSLSSAIFGRYVNQAR